MHLYMLVRQWCIMNESASVCVCVMPVCVPMCRWNIFFPFTWRKKHKQPLPHHIIVSLQRLSASPSFVCCFVFQPKRSHSCSPCSSPSLHFSCKEKAELQEFALRRSRKNPAGISTLLYTHLQSVSGADPVNWCTDLISLAGLLIGMFYERYMFRKIAGLTLWLV